MCAFSHTQVENLLKGPARCSRVLDPPLAFTYRKNDDNFNFNAISVDKVYIDCWIKILGRLFVNDKQILTECFKSFLIL